MRFINKTKYWTAAAFIPLVLISCARGNKPHGPLPVRVAVIGGMTMTPLWSQIQEKFESDSGIRIEVVISGTKPNLVDAMVKGRIDFLTMHSSDRTSNLVADGWARNLRSWAKNDLVIVGPVRDPAGISGLRDGRAAITKIVKTRSNWIDFRSNVCQNAQILCRLNFIQ